MKVQELYNGIKSGKILKSQLTNNEKGELYKYMIESGKISSNQVKPEVVKKYNLTDINKPTVLQGGQFTELTNPFSSKPASQIYKTIGNDKPNFAKDIGYNTNNLPKPNIGYTPPISTNPENDLVDILSNLSMGDFKQLDKAPSQTSRTFDAPITWQSNPLQAFGKNVSKGFGTLGRAGNNLIDMTLGDRGIDFIDNYLEKSKEYTDRQDAELARINQGTFGQFAGDVSQGLGQAIPFVVESLVAAPYTAATQGMNFLNKAGTQLLSNTAKLANPTNVMMAQNAIKDLVSNPNIIPSLIQGVGMQYEQALNSGATKDQAIKSAIAGGIPSGLIESMGGTENLASKLASKMPFGRTVLESGLGEAFEEIMQYPIENLAQKNTFDSDMPYFSMTENAVINPAQQAYNGATAFVSSALMGGVGSGLNKVFEKLSPQEKQIATIIESELNNVYTAIDKGTPTTEQDINITVEFLQGLEKQYPNLSEYLQGHIEKVDRYREQLKAPIAKAETIAEPTTNNNIEVEQTLDNKTNLAQNVNNDVQEEIKEIPTKTIPKLEVQDNILQESNNNIAELEQNNIAEQTSNEQIEETPLQDIKEEVKEQLIENVPNYFIGSDQKNEISELKKEVERYNNSVKEYYKKHGNTDTIFNDKLNKAKDKISKLTDKIQRKYFVEIDNRKIDEDIKRKVDKMDVKYLKLEDIDKPLYPENYFTMIRHDNSSVYVEIKGTPVKNDYGLDLFTYKNNGRWSVVDGRIGILVNDGNKKQDTINEAVKSIERMGVEEYNRIVKQSIEQHGATPRYIGIEKAKYQTRPIIEEVVKEETQDELKSKLDDLIAKKSLALTEAESKEIEKQIGLLKLKLQLFASPKTEETTGEFETSQFYSNSIRNALIIPEQMQNLMDETDFLYAKQTNKGQLEEAANNIEKDLEGVVRKIKQSKSIESGIQAAEALLIQRIYVEQGQNTGDYSKALDWLKTIQPKITNTAQSLQAQSMWKRFTLDNILLQVSKTIGEARTRTEEDKIDKTTDELKKEFDNVDKEKAGEVADDLEKNAEDILAKKRAKDDVNNGSTGSQEDIDNAQKQVDKAEKDVNEAENEVKETDKDLELKNAKAKAKRAKKSEAKSKEELEKLERDIAEAENKAALAKAKADLAKKKLNEAKKRLRKYKAILERSKANEVKYKENEKITQEEINKMPEELLAVKVENTLRDPKAPERDMLLEMINELMNVAKESPLPFKEIPKTDPIEFISQAISNREEYKRVWIAAKEILLEKYQDNSEVMDILSDYFEKGIKPTFSVKTLDKVMSKYIVSLKVAKIEIKKETKTTLSQVVRDWYVTGRSKTESMVEDIVKKSGLKEDEAKLLEKYIRNRMHIVTKQKKEQILETMFKDKIPATKNSSITAIEQMTNLGAFNNEKYKELAKVKLDSVLKRILSENDIDIGEIARQSAGMGKVTKEAIVEILRGQLGINQVELEKVSKFIAESFNRILGAKKDSLLRQLTKEREVAKKRAFYEKIVEMYNLNGFETEQHREWIAKKLGIPNLDDETVKRVVELTKTLEQIPTIGFFNNILRDMIQTEISYTVKNLVPSSRWRKVSTVQALMQLANGKTFNRNIIGNELAYRSERISKYVGTIIDVSKSKLTGSQRKITFKKNTKIFEDFKPNFGKDMLKAARAAMKGYKLYGYDVSSDLVDLQQGGKVFKAWWNPFNYIETGLNMTLDGADYAAMMRGVYDFVSEAAYLDGVNKGLKGEELNKNAKNYADKLTYEMYKMAREYGDRMTFKDKDSFIGNAFGAAKKAFNKFGTDEFGLGDILLKYARTGGVLLERSIEYSPMGFLYAYKHIYQAKVAYNKHKEYTKDVQKEVEMSIARALFGTIGFTGLGYMLASLGVVSGDDDDEYLVGELRKRVGLGKYQINRSALFRWVTTLDEESLKAQKGDIFFTYDWAMPMSLSVSFGVDLQKNLSGEGTKKDFITTTVASADSMMNMFGQSNLTTGIRNLFKGYDAKKNIASLAQNTITGFTGTFNNQLRQYFDNVYRDTSSDSFVQETINKVKNRLPGLSQTLPEGIDITGQTKEVYQNDSNNFFNVFFNPSFVTEYNSTPGYDLMLNLYDEVKSVSVIPNQVQDYLTIDKKQVPLTESEKKMYAEIQGRTTMVAIDKLAVSSDFKRLNKEEQAKKVEKTITKIADETRKEMRKYVIKRIGE